MNRDMKQTALDNPLIGRIPLSMVADRYARQEMGGEYDIPVKASCLIEVSLDMSGFYLSIKENGANHLGPIPVEITGFDYELLTFSGTRYEKETFWGQTVIDNTGISVEFFFEGEKATKCILHRFDNRCNYLYTSATENDSCPEKLDSIIGDCVKSIEDDNDLSQQSLLGEIDAYLSSRGLKESLSECSEPLNLSECLIQSIIKDAEGSLDNTTRAELAYYCIHQLILSESWSSAEEKAAVFMDLFMLLDKCGYYLEDSVNVMLHAGDIEGRLNHQAPQAKDIISQIKYMAVQVIYPLVLKYRDSFTPEEIKSIERIKFHGDSKHWHKAKGMESTMELVSSFVEFHLFDNGTPTIHTCGEKELPQKKDIPVNIDKFFETSEIVTVETPAQCPYYFPGKSNLYHLATQLIWCCNTGQNLESQNAAVRALYSYVQENTGNVLLELPSDELTQVGTAFNILALYLPNSSPVVNCVAAENAFYCLARSFAETRSLNDAKELLKLLTGPSNLLSDAFTLAKIINCEESGINLKGIFMGRDSINDPALQWFREEALENRIPVADYIMDNCQEEIDRHSLPQSVREALEQSDYGLWESGEADAIGQYYFEKVLSECQRALEMN